MPQRNECVRWRWQRKDGRGRRARCACHGSIPTRDPYGRSRGSQYELSRTMLLSGAGSGGMVTSEGVAWRNADRVWIECYILTWQKILLFPNAKPQSISLCIFFARSRHSPEKPKLYCDPLNYFSGSQYSLDSAFGMSVISSVSKQSRLYCDPLKKRQKNSGSQYRLDSNLRIQGVVALYLYRVLYTVYLLF